MTLLGCAIALAMGITALPDAGAAASKGSYAAPAHVKPATLLASSKPYFHRFIVKYRNGSSAQRDSGMRQLALDAAMARAGIIDMASVRAGARPQAPRIASPRRLAVGADVVTVGRKLTVAETAALLHALRADKQVEYAQIDRLKHASWIPNDTKWGQLWGLNGTTAGIGAVSAWNVTRGTGVVVAVIDTGISTHPDLQANVIPGYDFISDAAIARDGDGRDANPADQGDWNTDDTQCDVSDSSWHGTHVAGTIAAVGNNSLGVVGVAYGAKVMPIRVLGQCGGYTSDISDAVIWAAGGTVTGVPANTRPAKVINLSLGGSGACGPTEQAAMDSAIAKGATIVVAAGNESSDVSTETPANCQGVVAVAAIDSYGHRAGFSNYGAGISLSAPGVGIYSTANAGTTVATVGNYPAYSGTSMAAPHVSGVVALMRAAAGANVRTPAQIKQMLEETAKPFPTACSGCGSGMLNAPKAVALAVKGLPRTLSNNVPVAISGALGSTLRYRISVPTEARNLRVSLTGGTGNADLYLRYSIEPTTTTYNCRPYLAAGATELCTVASPAVGYWYVNVVGRAAYSKVTLRASYELPTILANNATVSGLAASTGTTRRYMVSVPYGAKNLKIETSGGTGNADLFVRRGATPTATVYDCYSAKAAGLVDTCAFAAPAWGNWYVSLVPRSSYANLTLKVTYTEPTPRTYQNLNNYTISDFNTIASPIPVANRTGNASPTMQVGVVIRHTYVGDLVIELLGPDGQAYMISNQGYGDQVDLVQTFTIDASASPASGTWKLRVTDNGPADVGYIDSWSMTF
jgi:serine protease